MLFISNSDFKKIIIFLPICVPPQRVFQSPSFLSSVYCWKVFFLKANLNIVCFLFWSYILRDNLHAIKYSDLKCTAQRLWTIITIVTILQINIMNIFIIQESPSVPFCYHCSNSSLPPPRATVVTDIVVQIILWLYVYISLGSIPISGICWIIKIAK